MHRRKWAIGWLVCQVSLAAAVAWAAGGVSVVASKGQAAYIAPTWLAGTDALVNDPQRAAGWNSWFTEWPNDVHHYGFEIQSMADLNRLIEKLAAIKSDLRQIRLSHLPEPDSIGWVARVPQGSNLAVLFSIGDQSRIDQWYARVRRPFGVLEFLAAPEAVPPTLTIYVQNKLINLDELRIPQGIEVVSGQVPTVFHRFNTRQERDREKQAPPVAPAELSPPSRAAQDQIDAYLRQREPERR